MFVLSAFIALVAAGVFATGAFGDATTAATIAGIFTLVNTMLNAVQLKQHKDLERGMLYTHKILTAPRRAIHDANGKIIGTMLELEDDDWIRVAGGVSGGQRHDDIMP